MKKLNLLILSLFILISCEDEVVIDEYLLVSTSFPIFRTNNIGIGIDTSYSYFIDINSLNPKLYFNGNEISLSEKIDLTNNSFLIKSPQTGEYQLEINYLGQSFKNKLENIDTLNYKSGKVFLKNSTISINGRFIPLNTLSLNFNNLVLFPNPASQEFNLEFQIAKEDNYKLELYKNDTLITTYIDQVLNLGKNSFKYDTTIGTDTLANGLYCLKLSGNNQNRFSLLIVERN